MRFLSIYLVVCALLIPTILAGYHWELEEEWGLVKLDRIRRETDPNPETNTPLSTTVSETTNSVSTTIGPSPDPNDLDTGSNSTSSDSASGSDDSDGTNSVTNTEETVEEETRAIVGHDLAGVLPEEGAAGQHVECAVGQYVVGTEEGVAADEVLVVLHQGVEG
ncbi:unnamed protein product [Hermetia illucens]|uniref:Uncharacterized protein n=1 Tax=Hermetia illucens TaxID=343691 RepID=A0A7R8UYU5_HERIL|nr:unnamed protein product [Hermetia illucens]